MSAYADNTNQESRRDLIGLFRKNKCFYKFNVHLSEDKETAVKVGERHGIPAVLKVLSRQMFLEGIPFYRSENGVWLTKHVDSRYLESEGV